MEVVGVAEVTEDGGDVGDGFVEREEVDEVGPDLHVRDTVMGHVGVQPHLPSFEVVDLGLFGLDRMQPHLGFLDQPVQCDHPDLVRDTGHRGVEQAGDVVGLIHGLLRDPPGPPRSDLTTS